MDLVNVVPPRPHLVEVTGFEGNSPGPGDSGPHMGIMGPGFSFPHRASPGASDSRPTLGLILTW